MSENQIELIDKKVIEKLLIFTYEPNDEGQTKFYIRPDGVDLNDLTLSFEKFKKIVVFENQEIFQDYGVYFLYLSIDAKNDLNKLYKIVQFHGKNLSDTLHYESREFLINEIENEFLIDLNFLDNNKYSNCKKAFGKRLENKVHQLLMLVSFVIEQDFKNPFQLINNLLEQFTKDVEWFTSFDNSETLNFFIEFLVDYLKRKRINETFFTILLGIFDSKNYNQVNSKLIDEKIIKIFISYIRYLGREDISKILEPYNNLKVYFTNGVRFLFFCTKFSFDIFIPFCLALADSTIDFLKLYEIQSNLSKNCKFYLSSKKFNSTSLKNCLKNLNNRSDLEFILDIIIDFCSDIDVLIDVVHAASSVLPKAEQIILEKILGEKRKRIISNLMFAKCIAVDSDTYYKNLEKFLCIKELMESFELEFVKYMVKISNDLRQISILLENLMKFEDLTKLNSYEQNECYEIWALISEMYNDNKLKSDLDSLIKFFYLIPKNIDHECIRNLIENIRKKLKQSTQKLVLKDENYSILKQLLNDKLIFPFGSLNFMKENYYSLLSQESNEQIKFLISEIIAKQTDRCESNEIMENCFFLISKLNMNSNIEEFTNNIVTEIFSSLKSNLVDENLCYELFETFLKDFFKKTSINYIIEIVNYSLLNMDENFEKIYTKILKEILESNNSIDDFKVVIKKLKSIDYSNSIREKLIVSVYSSRSDLCENLDSVREFLFKTLNTDHLIFISLHFSELYHELNNLKSIKKLKSWIRDSFIDLVHINLTNSEVEWLKKFDDEKVNFLQEIADLCFEKTKRLDLKIEIHKALTKYDSNFFRIKEMLDFFEFISDYSKDFEPYRFELLRLTENNHNNNSNSIYQVETFSKFQHLANIYKKYRNLKSFRIVFDDMFQTFGSNLNDNQFNKFIFFNNLFDSVELKYVDLINMIKSRNLSNKSIQKYFIFLTNLEEINKELSQLNLIKNIDKESQLFFRKSVFNFSRLELYKSLFSSLFKVFYMFGLSTEDEVDEPIKLIEKYICIKFQNEIQIEIINNLIEDIQKQVGNFILREKNDETILTINEMAKSFNLLSFLMSKKEYELRNIIDKIDYHGNGSIQPQSIIELLKVQQFFFKIYKIAHKKKVKKEFLYKLIDLIENDENFKNIATLLHTSNHLTESFKVFFDTIHNREETIKMKIMEIAKNSEFFIEYFVSTGNFNLKTEPRNDKVLTLNDLFDLRDRALLSLNNNEIKTDDTTQLIPSDEVKDLYKIFIESVESLNRIIGLLEQLNLNGYAVEEYFTHGKIINLKIINRDNSQIKNFEKMILDQCENWRNSLLALIKKYRVLTYYWGKDFFHIEKMIHNEEFDSLKEYLSYINLNIMNEPDSFFPSYPHSTSQISSIERLELLAEYLENLMKTLPKQTQLKIEPSLNLIHNYEEMILIKADSAQYYIDSLLACYKNFENEFPISNQILFCNAETTWQELRNFLYRSIINNTNEKRLYSIIGPERLDFDNQSVFLEMLDRLINTESHFIRLAIITHDKNVYETLLSNFKPKKLKLIELKNFGENLNQNGMISTLVNKWKKEVCTYISAYSGLGKSTLIRQTAKYLKSNMVRFTITETDSFIKLGKRFKECLKDTRESNITSIHFDILHSNEHEILNEFLFSIIYLNSIKTNDFVIVVKNVNFYFLEIANSFENSLKNNIYLSKLFRRKELNEFKLENFLPSLYETEEITTKDDSSLLQIVCNYLKIYDEKKCSIVDFRPEVVFDENNKDNYLHFNSMIKLSDVECLKLLSKYFVSKKALSFTILNNFIKLLGFYFVKLSENDFLGLESLGFIIENIQDKRFRSLILGLRERIVKILIDLALENVTSSISNVRRNQQNAMEILGLKQIEREIKNMNDKLISFQDCNYLIIVFSKLDSYFEFIYSKVNQIPQSVISLYRAQSLGTNQSHFKDYRNENHESLLKRLQKLFGPIDLQNNDLFLFDSNLFSDDPLQKKIIENLNNSLKIINIKLETYIITADNYLKMMLIYNKINSNLPVVMIGETGCGKTSLISYLAVKILNVKLIIFNTHAGVTQESFLDAMKNYFLIVSRINSEVWIFFDEFNTSECMYLVTEMISERTLLSKPVPGNLKILAACNPYKIKSKKIDVGLVIERESTKLVHVVLPLPERLIDNVWDFGSLNPNDEKNYIYSMVKILPVNKFYWGMFTEILSSCQEFTRQLEEESSVSLRDVNRFRVLFDWFCKFNRVRPGLVVTSYHEYFVNNMVLALMVCYYVRITKTESRDDFLEIVSKSLLKFNVKLTREIILNVYEKEQDEYLNRMNLPKGIAKNNALRENVFVSVICIMNKIPLFICGKPGCSKTLSIQLILSYLKGIESVDQWFKKLPGIFAVTYQGSESSTSEGILMAFEKAKEITSSFNKYNAFQNVIPLIIFEEMGLAEISKKNPLKVLHSLLETGNNDVAFVGISNWRLDASKMNRGIFLSRPDLSLEDLEKTAEIILNSYNINENLYTPQQYDNFKVLMKNLARAYYVYKMSLAKGNYCDFHGTRDFYSLIKQISEKINEKHYESKANLIQIIKHGIERNFQGIKIKNSSFKDVFMVIKNDKEYFNHLRKDLNVLDLIKSNLKDPNSRYLMLITKGDSASFILDNYFKNSIPDIASFIGSQFEDDLIKEENNFRILSDIILYMEKGWTITLEDMDSVYGSLYDMFNQNFTLIGGTRKNCRIALGSVTNPMCYVKDNFKCMIILREEDIKKCEPPFLNRFEKFILNFDAISSDYHNQVIKNLNDWLKTLLFDQYENVYKKDKKPVLALNNLIVNYNSYDTISSLVFYYDHKYKITNPDTSQSDEKNEFIMNNCKQCLIKLFTNFSLLFIARLETVVQKEFLNSYINLFKRAENLNMYLSLLMKENQNSLFKTVVYTFDSVHKPLKLPDLNEKYEEIKTGNFKSEITLTQVLNSFYKSKNIPLLIIRFNWSEDFKHLKLVKYLIEKFENSTRAKKSVCIIIHIDFYSNNSNNEIESSIMSFVSGWEQIMLDNLDDKFLALPSLITKTTNQVLISEKIFSINEIFSQLLTNALNKISYQDFFSEYVDENKFNDLIDAYKIILTEYLSDSNDQSDLIEVIKRQLINQIEKACLKDWINEILKNDEFIRYGYDLNLLIKNVLNDEIMIEFLKIFYSLEKYFPFESYFNFDSNNSNFYLIKEIVFQIIQDHFDNINENNLKVINAIQSNRVDVIFELKFPFILKEIEILDKVINEEIILSLIEAEKLVFISDTDHRLKLKEVNECLLNEIERSSIFSKYLRLINQDEYLKDLYLSDIIKLKTYYLTKNNSEFKDLFFNLTKIICNVQDVSSVSNLYLTVAKSEEFFEKVYDYLKLFNGSIQIDMLIEYLKQVKLKSFMSIENQLFSFIFNYSTKYFSDLSDPENLTYSITDLASIFDNLFIESISIESLREKYYFFYFITQFFKIFSTFYSNDESIFKTLFIDLLKIITPKLNNDEFLKDIETVREIVLFINSEIMIQNETIEKLKTKFEFFIYSLSIELYPDNDEIMDLIFKHNCLNKNSIEYIYSILQKFLFNFNIDMSLSFLTDSSRYTLLVKLNDCINRTGLESEISVIFIEILRNNLIENNDLSRESFNDQLIHNLFEILNNYETGLETDFTRGIKLKHLAYLTSITYLKELLFLYLKDILKGNYSSYQVLNQYMDSNHLKCLNSFRILILRGLNENVESYNELKDLILCNKALEWKRFLNFGDIKKKFEVYLVSDGLFKKIITCGKCIDIKKLDDESTKKLLHSLLLSSNNTLCEKDYLTFYLSLFNNFYVLNSNDEFSTSKSKQEFVQYVVKFLNSLNLNQPRSLNQQFVLYVIKNFQNNSFLKIDPMSHIEDLKVISLIYHSFSIVLSYSKFNNPISGLFFKNGQKLSEIVPQHWICSRDDDEFTLLQKLSSLTNFVSDTQLNTLRFNPKKDYSLFKCSNECNYYYIVGDCTLSGENTTLKCPKGHLLMGPKQHVLYERDGHKRIPNPADFIKNRLYELKQSAPVGYSKTKVEMYEIDYTVRDLKPLTFRILDLILHSTLFMLKQLDFYSEGEVRNLIFYRDADNISTHLLKKIINDYRIISKLLDTQNQSYLFIHSVLGKLPDILESSSFRHVSGKINYEVRNQFEMAFQEKIINQFDISINQTINFYRNQFMIRDEVDEIKILVNHLNETEIYVPSLKENYPFIKLMKFNTVNNDIISFEKTFNKSSENRDKYPLIELYLKNKENLLILEILPIYLELLNFLLNKYDYNITRKEAREKIIKDAFDNDDEMRNKFENLKYFWNKYLRIELSDDCKIFQAVELRDDSPLSLLLCDNKLEIGSGIHAKLILKYLASYQNSFLDQILQIDIYKLPYLKSFNRESLGVNAAKQKHLINIRDFQADFFIKFYSLLIPDTMKIEYDLEKFQLFLIKTLINGKRLLDISDKSIRYVQYSGELLNENVLLISNLRDSLTQEKIDDSKLIQIRKFIDQLKENNDNNGLSILKNIFKSLEIFICHLNTTNKTNLNGEMIFKDYFKNVNLKNLSDFVKNLEPICSLSINNLIEIYEIFEHEMFYMSLNQFEDKYKKRLSSSEEKQFFKILEKCNGIELPDVVFFRDAIIKFSMRCLLADINENDSLNVYLSNRFDLWPSDIPINMLEKLGEMIPNTFQVMHTLGSLIDLLNQYIDDGKTEFDKKTKEICLLNNEENKNERIGRAKVISSKEKHDNKNKKIFII